MRKLYASSKSLFQKSFSNVFSNKQLVSIQKFSNHHKSEDSSECPYLNYQNHGYNLIRNKAPDFSGNSWWKDQFKQIKLSDFQGKWVCLFFYPLDFTFVCPTEIVDFNNAAEEFSKLSNLYLIKIVRLLAAQLTLLIHTENGHLNPEVKEVLVH